MKNDKDVTIHIDIEDTRISLTISQLSKAIDPGALTPIPVVQERSVKSESPLQKASELERQSNTIAHPCLPFKNVLRKEHQLMLSPTLPKERPKPKEAIINGYRVKVQYEDGADRKNILESIMNARGK